MRMLQEFCLLALSQPRPQASEDGSTIMARRSLSPRLQVSGRPMHLRDASVAVVYAVSCVRCQLYGHLAVADGFKK
jgi:hypothetical protein